MQNYLITPARQARAQRLVLAFILLTAAAIFGASSLAQAAEKIRSVSVPKGWKGAAYATDSGYFSHCVANARYKSKFSIFVSISGDYKWKLAFLDHRKRLSNGRTVARIRIDGSRWFSFRTQVKKNNFFVLNMPANSRVVRSFRQGRRLYLDVDGSDYPFNLTNTNRLLPALARCVKTYVARLGNPPKRTARLKRRTNTGNRVANRVNRPSASNVPAAQRKRPRTKRSAGTGMLVSENGHVLTNYHVVGKCQKLRVTVLGEPEAEAKLLKADRQNDLAVLKISSPVSPPSLAQFRVGKRLQAGEAIAVYGFPLPGTLSVSGNIVSGHITSLAGLRDDARFVQISSPIQPGNSGGPLIDSAGQIIGVVTAKLDELKFAGATGSMPQNVNFAIKSNVAMNFMDAHSIPYKTSSAEGEFSLTQLVEEAKKYTVHVKCN